MEKFSGIDEIFQSIFVEVKLSEMQHFFVEQETNYSPNPSDSIKVSWEYVFKELI